MNDVLDDSVSLRNDVAYILIECHRDRNLAKLFAGDVDAATLTRFAEQMARRLGAMIGGRYVPKQDNRPARDAAVWAAFTGRNHADVMREFSISKRLLYSILARKRRGCAT